jgi:hypothetical protein
VEEEEKKWYIIGVTCRSVQGKGYCNDGNESPSLHADRGRVA